MPDTSTLAALLRLPLLAATGCLFAQSPLWIQRTFPTVPTATGSMSLAYDAARQRTVFFTNYGAWQTWTYDGASWELRATSQGPTGSYIAGPSCYDSARQRVVLMAGNQSTGLQTWEWDGAAWSQRASGGLPGRHSFALTYDAARQVTLLFGGSQGSSTGYADLWAWDGSAWTQVMNGGPTPRYNAAMVYDEQQQTVVLFGGEGALGGQNRRFDDTWEWNGVYWRNHFGLPAPPARYAHAMVYDSTRHRTVLFGGAGPTNQLQDTWEWDGTAWLQVQPQGVPPNVGPMVYDRSRGLAVLLHVGSVLTTWEYLPGPSSAATYTAFGTGCAGPAGTPQLTAVGGSLPRIGSTLQLALSNLPPSPFNVPFGIVGFDATVWNGQPLPLSLANLGMPGCEAWVAPAFAEALANVQGTASWNLALPMNQNFVGLDLYVQGAVLAPGWNTAGVVLGNAGHARVGSP